MAANALLLTPRLQLGVLASRKVRNRFNGFGCCNSRNIQQEGENVGDFGVYEFATEETAETVAEILRAIGTQLKLGVNKRGTWPAARRALALQVATLQKSSERRPYDFG